MSSHSDHDSDNDGTIDEMMSSHSDQDSENEGSRRVSLVEQELLTFPEHLSSRPVLVRFVLFLP